MPPSSNEQVGEQPPAPAEAEPVEQAGPSQPAPAEQPGAEQPGAEAPGAEQPAAAGDVSDDQVEAFARAYVEIVEIQNRYGASMPNAGSEEEVQEMQEQAEQELTQAIERQGLSVPEFEEIGQAADTDAELRNRIESEIQEVQTQ